MTPSPCSTCSHFTRHGTERVGSCAKGGPDSTQGCADVAESETCEKHEERKK